MSKTEVISQLEDHIRNNKQFRVTMLAELIYRHCNHGKLEKAVEKWKSKPPAQVPKPNEPNNKTTNKPELREFTGEEFGK